MGLGLVLVASTLTASPGVAQARYVTRLEQPDNSAYFLWQENGQVGAGSSVVAKPGDPLTFHVYGFPPPPGGKAALFRVEMWNNSGGEVRFPAGLVVPVLVRNGSRAQIGVVRHPTTSLAPGTGVTAETLVPLHAYGQYSISAFSVVQFART